MLERTSGDEHEKVEIACDVAMARKLRLFIWNDLWVFIDARTPTKSSGWAWEFTHEGRFAAGEARALVEALEDSIDAAAAQSSEDLERVWKPLLASGPRLVS